LGHAQHVAGHRAHIPPWAVSRHGPLLNGEVLEHGDYSGVLGRGQRHGDIAVQRGLACLFGRTNLQINGHGCLLPMGLVSQVVVKHVDRPVEQPPPAIAARIVGELGVDQAADERDIQVDVLLPGYAVVRDVVAEHVHDRH
jgi:hypothetical protein